MKLASVFLVLTTAYALGAEPNKVDFTAVLMDQDNKPMMECADNPAPRSDAECKIRHSVTLGMIALRALSMPEQGLAPEKSLERGQLALRVYKSEDVVLKAEEITLIKAQ